MTSNSLVFVICTDFDRTHWPSLYTATIRAGDSTAFYNQAVFISICCLFIIYCLYRRW